MEYNDFVAYFENLTICYHQTGYQYEGVPFKVNTQVCFKVRVPSTGKYYFQTSQKSIRLASYDVQDLGTRKYYHHTAMIVAPEDKPFNCLIAVKG